MFNLLTEANVFAEDKLFATLDSTTRALEINSREKILISDTVGFIRKLPPHLVASFKSTLNEVRDADIILHIIDFSHPYFEDHLKIVDETLKEFKGLITTEIKVFNKVDSVTEKHKIDYVKNTYPQSVIISASKGINISSLKEMLKQSIEKTFVEEEIILPIEQTKIASTIHQLAEVLKIDYNHETVSYRYRTNPENAQKIKKLANVK